MSPERVKHKNIVISDRPTCAQEVVQVGPKKERKIAPPDRIKTVNTYTVYCTVPTFN